MPASDGGEMARIFITGSSDGLGQMAARFLCRLGHAVVLHARDPGRGRDALAAVPEAEAVMIGDLTSIRQIRQLADQVNALEPVDAVIHNAAVGYRERARLETEDGLPHVFAVNTLAPYILTALIRRPRRLVYVSSELHRRGDASLQDLDWRQRSWNGHRAYCDSKLHDVLLSCAVARRWPDIRANAMEPGWVPTKLGGPRATGDLDAAYKTQAWLSTGCDPDTQASGDYFYHLRPRKPHAAVREIALQDRLLAACERLSGISFPQG